MNHFPKEWCKYMVKCAVRNYWIQELIEHAEAKSTLERCHLTGLQVGCTHPVWDSVQPDRIYVMHAIVKECMLTGTYLLQSHKKN